MELRHLTTKVLKELHAKYAVDLIMARHVENVTASVTLKEHAGMDVRYLYDKMDLVDMELKRRPDGRIDSAFMSQKLKETS